MAIFELDAIPLEETISFSLGYPVKGVKNFRVTFEFASLADWAEVDFTAAQFYHNRIAKHDSLVKAGKNPAPLKYATEIFDILERSLVNDEGKAAWSGLRLTEKQLLLTKYFEVSGDIANKKLNK